MTLPATERPTKPGRSRRRRWIWVTLASSPAWVGLLVLAYAQHSVNERVRLAIAEADRGDPNWRLADLEAHRIKVVGAENSADRGSAAFGLVPRVVFATNPGGPRTETSGPPRGYELYDRLTRLPPDGPIPPVLAAALRDQLADCAEALATARPLAGLGEGAFPLKYNNIWIATILPHVQNSRDVARLLHLDAIARVEAGDADGAVESCRGILGVARSIGDEPIVVSQLVRLAHDRMALAAIERVLARGVASGSALKRLQSDLSEEAEIPFLRIGVRGERAGMFDLTEKISTGALTPASLAGLTGSSADQYLKYSLQIGPFNRYNQALLLEYLNRGVAITERPVGEQPELWDAWMKATEPGSTVARYAGVVALALKADLKSAANGQLLTVAGLRVGVVGLACKRFRLARGRWPDRLDELAPEFLDPIPDDPYTASPLRLVRRGEGIVVYAVGEDRKDDGGTFDSKGRATPGSDVGMALRDAGRRGRSAEELPGSLFPR